VESGQASTRRTCRVRPELKLDPRGLVCLELGVHSVEVMCYPQARPVAPRNAERVEAAWGPVKRAEYARAEIRDPDGNPIELRQWHRSPR
jgi:hypothetical protein